MICPTPNTHDPNPTAVPIKEAIKETFRVLMAILDCWIRQKPQFRSIPDPSIWLIAGVTRHYTHRRGFER